MNTNLLTATTGVATVTGEVTEPVMWVSGVDAYTRHPVTHGRLIDFIEGQPRALFDRSKGMWKLTGLSAHPQRLFSEAGLDIRIDPHLAATSLDELWQPLAKLDTNGRDILVYPRFAGYQRADEWTGWASVWDKTVKAIRMPVSDVFINGQLRPHLSFDQASIDTAMARYRRNPVKQENAATAAYMAYAIELPEGFEQAIPAMGRAPFEYQKPGALAVAAGHRLLADPPGVGKSLTSITAAVILDAKRIIITCPPVITVNWGRELQLAIPGIEVNVISPKKKKLDPFPTEGAIVIADSLLASRPALATELAAWNADVMIVDEAHRFKNLQSKRTGAILDLAESVKHRPFVLTGTPVLTGVHELVPLLELTGHLTPIFGGADAFLKRFCTRTPYGSFKTKMKALPQLNTELFANVWTRRERERVLPHLPPLRHDPLLLEVDKKLYDDAHKEAFEKVQQWLEEFIAETGFVPVKDQIDEYAKESFQLVSHLRVASALTKIPAAVELIATHVQEDPENVSPLVVWAHHKQVIEALAVALSEKEIPARFIVGGQPDHERQASIDDYQAGQVRVLIASITAAGVGVTLTRGSDALFVEPDWSAAVTSQAIDRQRRIGQNSPVYARTLVALGTLDERIQEVIFSKQDISERMAGDQGSMNASVFETATVGPADIVRGLVEKALLLRN